MTELGFKLRQDDFTVFSLCETLRKLAAKEAEIQMTSRSQPDKTRPESGPGRREQVGGTVGQGRESDAERSGEGKAEATGVCGQELMWPDLPVETPLCLAWGL